MDFFQAQDDARRRTRWLGVMFLAALVAVVIAVNVLVWILGAAFFGANEAGASLPARGGFPPVEVILVTSLVTAGVILAGSGFKSLALRGGGGVVAKDLGGRLVVPHSGDADEQRLINVVEEMAIASGVPAPQVYVMDDEPGINAFAAGTEPANAVIGVTQGCVQRLTRAELQGVVAHEFSHILNGDMRLNIRLAALLKGITFIGDVGYFLLRHTGRVRTG
ncbi:MAG: M48 family metalloprotease, partial [Akkermansiaceae bacterium]|nr:M48 family metalloprotease [Akkermansiaceae bacterium]